MSNESMWMPSTASLSTQPTLIQVLRFLKSCVSVMVNETGLQPVIEMANVLLGMPAQDEVAAYLKRDSACAELIRDRYCPPIYDLEQLLTLPPDSLGYAYAAAMKQTGFNPNLHLGMAAETDGQYVEMRLSQTHDIWHVVTGFDVSEMGELGLLAFHLPQFPYPLSIGVIACSFLSSLIWEPRWIPNMIDAIAEGFVMGKSSQPLFAQKWEEGWEKPLSQWREELNIQPKWAL